MIIKCEKDYVTTGSVASYGRDLDHWTAFMYFCFLFVFVIVFAVLKSYITKKAADLDFLNDVPEDFTVMVTQLPSNEPDELVKKHFEGLHDKKIGRCRLEVESLCPAYEMKEFKKL